MFFYFFSSRRRHTRWPRDWSSDVCSSDLDLLTVENELRDKGLLDSCGGAGYLSELTRSVSSAANVDYHAQIIAEKATKRNLILGCTDIIKEAYDSSYDPYDVLDKARSEERRVGKGR